MDEWIFCPLSYKYTPSSFRLVKTLWACIRRFFSKSSLLKNSLRNTIRVSNSLNPDYDREVGPDLDPNCLQRLSADGTRRQRVNKMLFHVTLTIGALPRENLYIEFATR